MYLLDVNLVVFTIKEGMVKPFTDEIIVDYLGVKHQNT